MQFRTSIRILSFLTLILAQPMGAWAVLGGNAATIGQDGQPVASNGHQLAQHSNGVQQQSVLTAQNVTVTEYAASGVVFAISWSGPVIPDLSRLLGTYFPQYAAKVQTRPITARNTPITVQTSTLVVHASGHMRAYSGSAYAPALVPPSINLITLGVDP
ncbi:MAG: DUF2844 domain-containing protein [Betaproteobacteria bacterium]|nr:DUF2844 domain-containing protein [Betaproteobacteria bacterium]